MKYFIKKFTALIITLLIVSFLAFLAFSIIPGDPTARLLGTDEAGIATLTNAFELKEKAKAFKAENE